MPRRTALVVLAVLAAHASGAWAGPGPPVAVRRVIGTGDIVPGLGAVGSHGITLVALDAGGRALLLRGGERRTPGLYWADENGIAAAFDPAALDGLRLMEWGFGWNRRGDLALLATAPGPAWTWFGAALFVVDAGGPRRVLSAGDRDADGNPVCRLRQARINAAGQLAVLAHIATGGRPCGARDGDGDSLDEQAVYLVGGGLQRLTTSRQLAPSPDGEVYIDLLALADDGAAIVRVGYYGSRVVRLTAAGRRDVIGSQTRGPDGERLAGAIVVAISPSGELLFRAGAGAQGALYRTAGDAIVRVFRIGDPAPPELGGRLDVRDDWGALNDAGDVLIPQRLVVLFPFDGSAPRVLPGIALAGALNESGDVAVTELTADHAAAVTRWRNEAPRRLARTGDPLPGGEVLADGGADGRCAAADGRIAVGALAADGGAGLACTDAAGAHAVARAGDPAPGGRRFYTFHQCAFAGAQALVFTASILVPDPESSSEQTTFYRVVPSIYRATPERVERVIGIGDVTSDGAVVFDLLGVGGDDGAYPLLVDADARGRVLALATLDQRYGPTALLLRDADGSLRRLPIPLWNAGGGWSGVGFGTPSVTDHRFLSGETDTPTLPPFAAAASGRAALTAAAAPEPSYAFSQARLFGDGVFLIASERDYTPYDYVDVPIAFTWSDGVLRRVLDAREALPNAYRPTFEILRVAGDRAAFRAGGYPGHVFTYTLGDAVAREQPQPPDSADGRDARFAGLWSDGRSLLDTYDRGRAVISAWDGAVAEPLVTLADGEWIDAVTANAILFQDQDTVRALAPPIAAEARCPQPPPLAMATRTTTPTPSATAPPTRTRTAPPTRTGSATATPRCPAGGTCLQVGRAVAAPGGHAVVAVSLSGGAAVVATQNELRLPAVARLETCQAGATSGKQVRVSTRGDVARVLVLALDDVAPIGDQAELYRCTLRVADDAPAGRYPIPCAAAGASDAGGRAIPAGCGDGELMVTGAAAPSSTPSGAPTATPSTAAGDVGAGLSRAESSRGCAIAPAAPLPGGALLVWAALLACARRRRRRRAA